MARFLDRSGFVTTKTLFWVLVVASLLYGGYKFVPPYFAYYMMKTEVEDEAKNAHMYTDEAIARRILEKSKVWSVPIDRDSIVISRGRFDITVEVSYTVTISFFDRYTKDLYFYTSVTKPLKESTRILQ